MLCFWLFMMFMIGSGLGISLWLAIRGTQNRWEAPAMFSYICTDCGYKVSLPETEDVIDQLLAISNLHQEVSHGD